MFKIYNAIKLGQKIKKLRVAKKLSQKELANKINVPQSSMSDFENGKGNFNILKLSLIAEVLDTTLDDLLYECLDKYTNNNKNNSSFYDLKLKEFIFSLNESKLTSIDNFIDYYLDCKHNLRKNKY